MSAFTIYKGVNPLDLPKRLRFISITNLQEKIDAFFGESKPIADYHFVQKRNTHAIVTLSGSHYGVFESADEGNTWVFKVSLAGYSSVGFIDDDYVGGRYREGLTTNVNIGYCNYTTGTYNEHITPMLGMSTAATVLSSFDKVNKVFALCYQSNNGYRGGVYACSPYFTGEQKAIRIYGNYQDWYFGEKTGGAYYGMALKDNVLVLSYSDGLYIKNILTENYMAPSVRGNSSSNRMNYLQMDSDYNLYFTPNSVDIAKLDSSDYTNNSFTYSGALPYGGTYVGGISIINDTLYVWNNPSYSPDGFVWVSDTLEVDNSNWSIIDNMIESTNETFGSPIRAFKNSDSSRFHIMTVNNGLLLYSLR